jgi:dTDP-4-dehydrorhamnose reductase
MTKVCVLGGSGLLGSAFTGVLTGRGIDFVAPTSKELDVTKRELLLAYLKAHQPDIVINCAAYTNVDGAEKEEEVCMELNVGVVETLIESGLPQIHFSTDYVFNAPAEIEIPEDYHRDPQSVYGRSKALMEERLEASEIPWWNIRTSWLWGPGGKNFVDTIRQVSKEEDELTIVSDQYGRPTYAPELADFVVYDFVMRGVASGHYHLQNQGQVVSWADFAEYFLLHDGWDGVVNRVTTEQYGAPAARPHNSVLANTKLVAQMKDWKETFTGSL